MVPRQLAEAARTSEPPPSSPPASATAAEDRDEPAAGYEPLPGETLPNFYDLIGVALFEPDVETIQQAAKARLSELRSDSTPGYREQRQSEVDAIAAGLAAMSNPQKRRAFDTELAEQLGVEIEVRGGRVVPVGQEGFGQLTVGIAVVGLLLILLWFALPWLRAALAPLFDVAG